MVPGLDHAITDNTLKKSQVRLIYLIKASAGGGGKGKCGRKMNRELK
jgi:acetyl/propionyl-CoA carboxylase alpha subunit